MGYNRIQETRVRTLLEMHKRIAKDISEEEFREEFSGERLEGRRHDLQMVEDMICEVSGV